MEQIFDPLIRRSDFRDAIGNLLGDATFRAHLQTIVVAGNKGTDNLDCRCNKDPCGPPVSPPDPPSVRQFQDFCENWKEMLFLTRVTPPITINGASHTCNRVLIFAGRRTAGQSRSTSIEKANPANYLEGANATSFHVPTASATDFAGASVFNWRTPATDLLRCLP